MPVVRATVAYDGTDFYGWARQPGLRTVEGVLAARSAPLTVAGRTDRGVHASANVVSFQLPAEPPPWELNARLPRTCRCWTLRRRAGRLRRPGADALARSYVYRPGPPRGRPVAPAVRAAPPAAGWSGRAGRLRRVDRRRHDFTAFTPSETQHVFFERTVMTAAVGARRRPAGFELTADALLRHMVRILVGTMLQRPTRTVPPPAGGPAALGGRADRAAARPVPGRGQLPRRLDSELMRILLTNDDGITSRGLFAAKQALERFGEVSVIAPDSNRSGRRGASPSTAR